MTDFERQFRNALQDVKIAMERAFLEVGGVPVSGSNLDQFGLQDGAIIIESYLEHCEWGVALEHLIYMIYSVDLPISLDTFYFIRQAGIDMRIDTKFVKEAFIRKA